MPELRHDRGFTPELIALAGMALLTAMDSIVKGLSAEFAVFQMAFLRFGFAALWVGLLVAIRRLGLPRRARMPFHATRAALMAVTASSFFYALGQLPLAQVFALSFTSPIFIAIFGAVFIREPLRWPVLVAIACGFAGMLTIVFGAGPAARAGTADPLAIAAALVAPVTYALSIVLLRAETAHEPPEAIVLVQSALVCLFLAPVAALDFKMPDAAAWAMFALVGLLGASGFLMFAQALVRMSAARFGVIEYTGLLWAALVGYLFFAEVPSLATWAGAAMIVAGCLVATRARRERER
jgi:S-adenosylmethionine uptake transporter